MELKQQAAEQALTYVRDGMVLGLGSGSSSAFFIDLLGKRLQAGAFKNLLAVPTSDDTARRAAALGIPLTNLVEHPRLDLAVDGADEVDPSLNLIKGLGKALLREKVIESRARQLIIIVDESKLVSRLGSRGPLPVEIVQFEAPAHIAWLASLGCRAELWLGPDGRPFITDNGNYLARCWFAAGIPDAYQLARCLADQPGIVEHGLFLDLATRVISAGKAGIQLLERTR